MQACQRPLLGCNATRAGVFARLALHSRRPVTCHAANSVELTQSLLNRTQWLLGDPSVQVSPIHHDGRSFLMIRDDLLHPYLGGNKARKLDGLWPSLLPATDVVTCGGLQSAHTAAVAAACAQHGKRCHLLVRGERPAVPTGHHLYARMFAHRVRYVSRADYADRERMFASYLEEQQQQQQQQQGRPEGAHAAAHAGASPGTRCFALVPEGAATPGALLGLVRQVAWLAVHPLLAGRPCNVVVDSGTGATATGGTQEPPPPRRLPASLAGWQHTHAGWLLPMHAGLALGMALLQLPWRVTGVLLAAAPAYYAQQQRELVAAFCQEHGLDGAALQHGTAGRLRWALRLAPRKFGRVLPGEVAACRAVARRHGVVLDPIWSLAAWEQACLLAGGGGELEQTTGAGGDAAGSLGGRQRLGGEEQVVMLHTGGALGLCGLAQRFPDQF